MSVPDVARAQSRMRCSQMHSCVLGLAVPACGGLFDSLDNVRTLVDDLLFGLDQVFLT